MADELCHPLFEPNGLPKNYDGRLYLFTMVVELSALLMNILAVFLIATIDKQRLKKIYQGTLVSLSIGNIITCFFFTMNTIANFCQEDQFFSMMTMEVRYCSLFLTITHLLCLMCADYIVRNSHTRTEIKPVTGLIILSWVMSICIGDALGSTHYLHLSVPVTIVMLLIFFGILMFYMTVMRSLKKKILKIQAIRNYFLVNDAQRYSRDPRRRISKFPRLIVLCTFFFVLPWCFIETKWHRHIVRFDLIHRYSDLCFSLQSQLVAIICLYLRIKIRHERQGRNFVSMKRKLGTFRKSLKHHSKENYELVLGLTSPDKTEIEKRLTACLATPSPSASSRMSQIFLKPYQVDTRRNSAF